MRYLLYYPMPHYSSVSDIERTINEFIGRGDDGAVEFAKVIDDKKEGMMDCINQMWVDFKEHLEDIEPFLIEHIMKAMP